MARCRTFFRLLLVLLVSLILMLVMTGSAAAETDVFLGIAFHPFTLDGNNSTCVPWTDSDIGQTRNCDPINLTFPGRTWMEVRDLLQSKGWSTSGLGSGQWLHYDGPAVYREDEQLYKADVNNTRYHIRLWQAPGNPLLTFASVHHESGFIVHTIDMDWEQAEADVGEQLCAPDCEETGPFTEQIRIQGGDGEWRGWANNGSSTVIPAPASPDMPPTVNIVNPVDASTVSGLVAVRIQAGDDKDPVGTLVVEWNIDGGAWQPTTYNTGTGYYEDSWNSTTVADGSYIFNTRAMDSINNTTGASNNITVDNLNDPPQASFTYTCVYLICNFDASDSSDPDGVITDYAWDFGDGNGGSGFNPSHTYGAAGTYNVAVTVTDDDGATGTSNQSVTVLDASPSTIHVGDLEGTSVNIKKNWQAHVSIIVHDAGEGLVAGATVNGSWSGGGSGASSCTTDSSGTCTVLSNDLPKKSTDSVIFSVVDITHPSLSYNETNNHDPQSNSSGTAIQVNKDGTTQDPGVLPNQPPLASFTYNCDDVSLTCTFDAAGSSDPDGVITDYAWDFGDGNVGSGLTTSHTFSTIGIFTVTLTVTDDVGDTAQDQQNVSVGQPGGDLALNATGYKVKGVHHADLIWSGASSNNVDIFRDSSLIATRPSGDGSYTDNIGQKGGGSYLYRVCEEGSSICSNEAIVEF